MTTTAVSAPEPPGAGGIGELVGRYVQPSPLGEQQLRGDCPFCRSRIFRVRPSHGALSSPAFASPRVDTCADESR